ncbi:MAG: phosphoribosyltransferase [Chloroflexi bacterium]|nr:phosphoribosyltransferase [Chloroflexota bacterium]
MAKNVFVDEIRSIFNNRTDAGQRLASELTGYKGSQTVVLAIPRGGVPVAVEVAVKLEASLDMIFVRKIPIPDEPEAGYGAVAEDGATILNRPMVRDLRLTASEIEEQAENVRAEIKRRSRAFREKLLPVSLVGKTVIIIDDGLASGYTMLAAVKSARQQQAAEVVVAVPAASMDGYELVKPGVS